MRNKIAIWIAVIVVVVLGIAGFAWKNGYFKGSSSISGTNSNQKLGVVGTFYPLAHFAQAVGGQFVSVISITPAGAEPHDYEPTPQDIVKAYAAKVFILNGGGVDTWAEKIEGDLSAQGITVVDMSKTIQLEPALPGEEFTADPHIWLDPVLAEREVGLIADALVKADPSHAAAYRSNAAAYTAQLQNLDQQFKTGLALCQLHDIVTSHAAFGYLAKRYGLNQISITGLSPDEEPSPAKMAEIADLAKQKHIKYIFFESLVSPKLSQTIANEVGAQTIAFNPLEGLTDQEITNGNTYVSVMKENLAALRTALDCK